MMVTGHCQRYARTLGRSVLWQCTATRRLHTREVRYGTYGSPTEVLEVVDRELEPLRAGQARLQFLGSPVNPADLNQITGVYPIAGRFRSEELGAVGGNEGVARVMEIAGEGPSPGTLVTVKTSAYGTWRSVGDAPVDQLIPLPEGLSLESAATLTINPPTAYRMLQDFVPPTPGRWVIQNGGNSGVGQAAIQIAKALGLRTVNVIRDRPDFSELAEYLKGLGADVVLREEEAQDRSVRKEWLSKMGKDAPLLGLNCVGGASMAGLTKWLSPGGVLVTYGGMARRPAALSTSSLIFQDLTYRGFWMSRWYERCGEEERMQMLRTLGQWSLQGQLSPGRLQHVSMGRAGDGQEGGVRTRLFKALQTMQQGYAKGKPLLVFEA